MSWCLITIQSAWANSGCLSTNVVAERKTSLGKDWHAACLKCARCKKTLTPGSHAEVTALPPEWIEPHAVYPIHSDHFQCVHSLSSSHCSVVPILLPLFCCTYPPPTVLLYLSSSHCSVVPILLPLFCCTFCFLYTA